MSLGVRISLLFGALFLVYGVQVPYLAVWLDWAGLSATEIAVATAMPLLLRLVATPWIAFAADREGDHVGAIRRLAWMALAALLLLAAARGFWPVVALVVVTQLCVQTISPLTDTVAMKATRAGLDYGRMRLWGSLTFIAASFLGGYVVDAQGAGAVIWLIVAGAAATALAAHLVPRRRPGETAAPDGSGARSLSLADVAALVRRRHFVLLMIAAGTIQAAHATFYVFGVLHWRQLGLSAVAAAWLWAIGVLAEVALFAVSRSLMARLGAVALLLAGAAAGLVRWPLMALDPPFWALALLQLLHAFTYGATHLGTMHYIQIAVPDEQAGTAQALAATFTAGIAMAGAMLLAGALYARFAGQSYLAMAAIAGVGLLAALAIRAIGPAPTLPPAGR